jgi:hypothetical protein
MIFVWTLVYAQHRVFAASIETRLLKQRILRKKVMFRSSCVKFGF